MSNTFSETSIHNGYISYDILFKEHSKIIYKLIHNYVRAKNLLLHNSEIDDIYQEVALKIFKNDYLAKYKNEKSSFITWLNVICRSTTIDFYRKRIRWMESILSEKDSSRTMQTADIVLFSLPAGVLTKRQTQVITLFFKEEMIAGEIAQLLGISSRTVRSIKFQALERLRVHYGASGGTMQSKNSETRRKVS
jgi:RNA polymerase sigma-70 factor (ECF subfamily)